MGGCWISAEGIFNWSGRPDGGLKRSVRFGTWKSELHAPTYVQFSGIGAYVFEGLVTRGY